MSDPRRLIEGGGLGRALLESGRITGPGDDEREELWRRLAAELPLAAGTAAAAVATSNGSGLAAKGLALGTAKAWTGAMVSKVAVAFVVAGSVSVFSVMAIRAPAPREVIPPTSLPRTAQPTARSIEKVSPLPAEPPVPVAPEETTAAEPAPVRAAVAPPASAAKDVHPSIASESALLLTARGALRAGDCKAARATLATAAARFPAGALEEERELLLIQALECAGEDGEAAARRTHFLREHPRSAYAPAAPTGTHSP